jgi:hypothetical protein
MPEELAAMPSDIDQLNSKIERVVADGQMMKSAALDSFRFSIFDYRFWT